MNISVTKMLFTAPTFFKSDGVISFDNLVYFAYYDGFKMNVFVHLYYNSYVFRVNGMITH